MDILDNLEVFRKNSILCDAKIISSNGEHDAHRIILAAASDFFLTMFQSDFKESKSGIIQLEDIHTEVMEDILKFLYTGTIELDEPYAADLYCLSDRFRMKSLTKKCTNYLIENMKPSICVIAKRLANGYQDEKLATAALRCMTHNFLDFVDSEDFLSLTNEELLDIIRRDDLNIEREEDVYRAVISWADEDPESRDEKLPSLLVHVRFPVMDLDFLEKNVVRTERLKDEKLRSTIDEIYQRCVRYYDCDDLNVFSKTPNDLPCYTRKFRVPSQIVYVCGGWTKGRSLVSAECYNSQTNDWITSQRLQDPAGGRCYYGCAQIGYIAYFAGGYDGKSYLNSLRCFNAVEKQWYELAPMYTKRCFNNLVEFKKQLYAIAGFDGVQRLSSVERFCASENQWIRVASLGTARSDSAAVACDAFLYVIGGYSGRSLRSVEYYDGEVWRYTRALNSRRSGAGAVNLPDGRIFVMGGYDGTSRQRTTEFYCPSKDTWTDGPLMHAARSNFATCVLRGYVYVIGGYTGNTTLNEVERYDISSDTWAYVASLNIARSAMRACVFKPSDESDSLHYILNEMKIQLLTKEHNLQRLGSQRNDENSPSSS